MYSPRAWQLQFNYQPRKFKAPPPRGSLDKRQPGLIQLERSPGKPLDYGYRNWNAAWNYTNPWYSSWQHQQAAQYRNPYQAYQTPYPNQPNQPYQNRSPPQAQYQAPGQNRNQLLLAEKPANFGASRVNQQKWNQQGANQRGRPFQRYQGPRPNYQADNRFPSGRGALRGRPRGAYHADASGHSGGTTGAPHVAFQEETEIIPDTKPTDEVDDEGYGEESEYDEQGWQADYSDDYTPDDYENSYGYGYKELDGPDNRE
ncbi:hypothetical protein BDV33DRAFT_197962 [Aspergillus novoparasiticus]|uniref:Uncharacterized protein n=1 Tax=Aspergillus novoparasiticus TaxID=986946 RepID=A0A5N6F961_9EURO|nr:hypothetical protein BDV33DRAFT_197962 [Aspergillus novoparasiticus]